MTGGLFKKLNLSQLLTLFWATVTLVAFLFGWAMLGDTQDTLKDDLTEILKDYRKVTDHGTYIMVTYNGEERRYEKANTREQEVLTMARAKALAMEIQSNAELRQAVHRACRIIVEATFNKTE